jgi:hypothetical protein
MKRFLSILLLGLTTNLSHAQDDLPMVVQFKFAPWGTIIADEDEFEYSDYEKYDMDFERSLGVKLILPRIPVYLAANQNVTQLEQEIPDVKVETYSVGFGGINYDPYAYDSGLYLLGSVGAGIGKFKFKNPDLNDWEAMFEANGEVGLRIQENLLLGVGVDYQLFGEPGDTKAHYWNLYVSTGLTF